MLFCPEIKCSARGCLACLILLIARSGKLGHFMRRIKVLSPWWGTAGGQRGPGGVVVQILMGFNMEKEKHLAVG